MERGGSATLLGEDRNRLMSDPLEYVRQWRRQFDRTGWWHSFELPDGSVIQGVSELGAQKMRIAQFPIPDDLTGKSVLDIGAWDGWFSFEMERRGAEVLAIDRFENPKFLEIRERLGSRVSYRQMDVYELSPSTVGHFVIVMFMGVLYHLKHSLLALERVCSVAREMALVESFVLRELEDRNLAQFYENDDFGGQVDNWWAPTTTCLLSLCRTAGFARVELANRHDYGAAVTCYRKWRDAPCAAKLLAAVNPDDFGINFHSERDEYVMCCTEGSVSCEEVFPEAGGYGSRPVWVGPAEGGNSLVLFKLPPGLSAGWHEVRLGASGNALSVAVDVAGATDRIAIAGACDSVTWKAGEVSLSHGFLSLWVEGLPENADVANVLVHVAGQPQAVAFVGTAGAGGVRQINVRIRPESCAAGAHEVVVSFSKTHSQGMMVEFVI